MDFILSFMLLGVIQGLILATILLFIKKNTLANKILSLLLYSMAYYLLINYLIQKYYSSVPHLVGINWSVILLTIPLIYLYAETLTRQKKQFKRSDLHHLVPFLIHMGYMTFRVFILNAEEKILFLSNPNHLTEMRITLLIYILQGIIYTPIIIRDMDSFSKNIKKVFSHIENKNIRWLQILMRAFLVVQVVILAVVILSEINPSLNGDPIVGITLTIFILLIGYFSIAQPEVFSDRQEMEEASRFSRESKEKDEKYKKTRLSREETDKILNHLLQYMENEKPHLDTSLTLGKLANGINTTPHQLSQIINSEMNKNFFNFINSYRVVEVKQRLDNPKLAHMKLIHIALDSGFNSQASFSKAFKEETGMTPSAYRKSFLSL